MCVYVCMCVHVYVYVCTCMCMYVCMYVCVVWAKQYKIQTPVLSMQLDIIIVQTTNEFYPTKAVVQRDKTWHGHSQSLEIVCNYVDSLVPRLLSCCIVLLITSSQYWLYSARERVIKYGINGNYVYLTIERSVFILAARVWRCWRHGVVMYHSHRPAYIFAWSSGGGRARRLFCRH